jgi:hypothetical protein
LKAGKEGYRVTTQDRIVVWANETTTVNITLERGTGSEPGVIPLFIEAYREEINHAIATGAVGATVVVHPEKNESMVFSYNGVKIDPNVEHDRISLHVNGDADVMDRLVIDGSEVRYSNEVTHMADWTPLCDYLKHKYGAVHTSWLSEESDGVDPGSVLDYEDDKAIVDAILEQDEKSLPAFLGIHPLLDARISSKLSRKE